jgi:hypothetical protein
MLFGKSGIIAMIGPFKLAKKSYPGNTRMALFFTITILLCSIII